MHPFTPDERDVSATSAAGQYLRRFWHPVCLSSEVERPGAKVRCTVLGQDIVIARTLLGNLIAIDERCPHRNASLHYGFVRERTIRCAYHGWEFDETGACVACPFESPETARRGRTHAYPTVVHYGLVFCYFGSGAPPKFVRFANLERSDCDLIARRHAKLKCSWLTLQENAADVVHTYFLHGRMLIAHLGTDPTGFSAPLVSFGFLPMSFGLIKTWRYRTPRGDIAFGFGNLQIDPSILCIETEVHWRVPVDRDHSVIFICSLVPKGQSTCSTEIGFRDGAGQYLLDTPFGQDAMALESSDNSSDEHLGRSDYGVRLFRARVRTFFQQPDEATNVDYGPDHIFPALRYMGGYLPSTGMLRSQSFLDATDRWSELDLREYVEFQVEPDLQDPDAP